MMMMMTVVVVMMMVMMMMTIIMMINDDHDHNHQDNDFYDDDDNDDNDTEMMIRVLRVSWVNCGKVGGLYCSMVQYCNVMKIKQNITFLIKNFNQLFLLLRKLIRSKHINFV